jgi:hypothetical protein
MFCAPGLVFGDNEGVGSRFHVLRSRNNFWRYRGSRVPFSSFTFPHSVSAIPRASGPVFKFCAPGLIFGGTEGVVSRFQVLRVPSGFRRYRGCRVPFSCFGRSDPIRRYRGRWAPISCFARLDSFSVVLGTPLPFSCVARPDSSSAVARASCLIFMFCVPGLVFGSTECVVSRFHVLRSRTRVPRYRGHRLPFSTFSRPESFSALMREL